MNLFKNFDKNKAKQRFVAWWKEYGDLFFIVFAILLVIFAEVAGRIS